MAKEVKREIKFRAWDKLNSKMLEVSTIDFRTMNVSYSYHSNGHRNESIVDPILMQFTGLKDKNGKEIYDGDILESKGTRVKIIWSNKDFQGIGFWAIKADGDNEVNIHHFVTYGEVIGNIYENPDLITNN